MVLTFDEYRSIEAAEAAYTKNIDSFTSPDDAQHDVSVLSDSGAEQVSGDATGANVVPEDDFISLGTALAIKLP